MQPASVLITGPAVDFDTLMSISTQALGYSIANASDSAGRKQHTAERFLSCLAAMQSEDAPVGLTPELLNHVSFSVLLAADERDTIEILECASGMPFVTTETVSRDIQLTVITGTLAQWRDAVVSGTRRDNTRSVYCNIMGQFEACNLNVWHKFDKAWKGSLFLLEGK